MYCRKCNVNIKHNKKVCPRCGLALMPGEIKGDNSVRMRRIIIIAAACALVVIAAFVTIFLTGRVPGELRGTWYEENGYGYLVFKPNGVVEFIASGLPSEGTYSFDSAADKGEITLNSSSPFTCDGTRLDWDGTIMTKKYVEQINLNFDSAFSQLAQ